jgi:hypothetical protein
MWWNFLPSETSSRPQLNEQHDQQRGCVVSEAPHERAHANGIMGSRGGPPKDLPDMREHIPAETHQAWKDLRSYMLAGTGPEIRSKALVPRVMPRVKNQKDRVRATGNGQVPRVAALAWEILSASELEKVREKPEQR